MATWYIVKENWSKTKEVSLKYSDHPYCGLGGDIWPLDNIIHEDADGIERKREKSREYVKISDGSFIYVCLDKKMAIEYYGIAKSFHLDVLLIEVSHPQKRTDDEWLGFDFGNPTGGYSIIESELFVKNKSTFIKRYLNQWGLFKNIDDIFEFIPYIEDPTDVDYYFPYRIKRIGENTLNPIKFMK